MLLPGRLGLVALLLGVTPALSAQGPGDHPRLVVGDGAGLVVPGPGEPFDNSGVFPAIQGQPVELDVSYQAFAQPNEQVVWGLLVSTTKTPFPLDVVPPPLLVAPPVALLGVGLTLDAGGAGALAFGVPAGVYAGDLFVQAVVLDASNVPRVQVSNGVRVDIGPPGFNVTYSFSLNEEGTNGVLRDVGVTDIPPELGSDLKPLGSQAAPAPEPVDPGAELGTFRFLEILPNTPDGPVNPLDRPMTFLAAGATSTQTQLSVDDTSGFPRRGRLLIPITNLTTNLWADIGGVQAAIPRLEVVEYDGLEPRRFLNCKRDAAGTKREVFNAPLHTAGQLVLGEYTMVTGSGARSRLRVSLDATNRDAPHVVIPPFTFTPATGGCVPPGDGAPEPVTMDLDLYLFERTSNASQGFMVLDRTTHTWRVLAGTERLPAMGTWNPIVAIAPDRRSMLAALRAGPSTWSPPNWDNGPDQLWAIRLDGEPWPATCQPTWQIEYVTEPIGMNTVRSRRLLMRSTHVVGPDPDNYVAYFGLANKWQRIFVGPGFVSVQDVGAEAEYVRQDVLLRDLVACPLTPPGSSKTHPTMPRPYLTPAFQTTGFGNAVKRFDPDLLVSEDRRRLLVTGGAAWNEEDVFVVRNVSVTQAGGLAHLIFNLTGHRDSIFSAGQFGPVNLRPFAPGGGGQGGKACFSPDGTRAAWLAEHDSRRDWIQVARTDASDINSVLNVYQDLATGMFREPGPYVDDRIVVGLRFADADTLVFLMGRNRYDDPLAQLAESDVAALEVFAYHIPSGTLTNVGQTGGTGFEALGAFGFAGSFASENDLFSYFVRAGRIGSGTASAPAGTRVLNLIGLNHEALALFDVAGDELGTGTALIPNLTVVEKELRWPVESLAAAGFVEGRGVQKALMYVSAAQAVGNTAENLHVFNRDAPFVNLPVTSATTPGVHVSNVEPSPFSALVAFARTDVNNPTAARQHPFVVDFNAFFFERDVLPTWTQAGGFLGRVMDGSMHFLPASGSAPEALVFAFGLAALEPFGIANTCAPTYYPLAAVSDLVAEPVPVTIPLTDTLGLGTDFRFYVHAATPSVGAAEP